MGYNKALDGLPRILKIIFCIPCLDILWCIYRIIREVTNEDWTLLIFDIVFTIIWPVSVIMDFIYTILYGTPFNFGLWFGSKAAPSK